MGFDERKAFTKIALGDEDLSHYSLGRKELHVNSQETRRVEIDYETILADNDFIVDFTVVAKKQAFGASANIISSATPESDTDGRAVFGIFTIDNTEDGLSYDVTTQVETNLGEVFTTHFLLVSDKGLRNDKLFSE